MLSLKSVAVFYMAVVACNSQLRNTSDKGETILVINTENFFLDEISLIIDVKRVSAGKYGSVAPSLPKYATVSTILEDGKKWLIGRDGHFRISNLPNPNPGNIVPESDSFI